MDKIAQYQHIIIGLLEEMATRPYANATAIEKQVLTDLKHNHFQLINIGWHRAHFVFNPLLHFDIKEDKIWIQQNGTELEIGDELVARGVAPEDIVFGFIPENERALLRLSPAYT
jgi:serine/threonine protein kinase